MHFPKYLAALLALAAHPALAQTTISSLPPASTLTGSEIVPVVQGGVTRRTTTGAIGGALAGSNTALQALPSTIGAVTRSGFSTPGDSPALVFLASSSACSLNSGAGDGGSQVPTSDGKCWLAQFPSTGADARAWGVVMDGATSADAALQKAENWAEANNQALTLPGGRVAITGAQTVALNHMALLCTSGPPDANASGGTLGGQGTTFWLTSTSVQPFTLKGAVRITGCNFYWPNQNGVAATPVAYPPLFTEAVGQQMTNIDLYSLRLVNAYDFIGASNNADVMGNVHVTDTYGYCIRYCFNLAFTPEMFHISGFTADPNLFQNIANTGNQYLQKWSGANSAFIRVFGNGNGTTTQSTVQVQGLTVTNSLVLNFRYGVLVDSTGAGYEMDLNANWDGTATAVQVNSGGCLGQAKINGLYYAYQTGAGGSDNAPMFKLNTPAGNCVGSLDIYGQLEQAQGDVLDITGSGWGAATISLGGIGNYGRSSTSGTYYFANINSSTLKFAGLNNTVQPAVNTGKGFTIPSAYSVTLVGNNFNGVASAIDVTSNTSPVTAVGNTAVGTSGTYTDVGAFSSAFAFVGNQFDKPNPALDGVLRLGSTILNTAPATIFNYAGLGTGAATMVGGATSLSGIIQLAPTGSPAASGYANITLANSGGHATFCSFTLQNNTGTWSGQAAVVANTPGGALVGLNWSNNGTALTAGSLYWVAYLCVPN